MKFGLAAAIKWTSFTIAFLSSASTRRDVAPAVAQGGVPPDATQTGTNGMDTPVIAGALQLKR
jgi:hypothetical protein